MKHNEEKQEENQLNAFECIDEARKETQEMLISGQMLLDGENMDQPQEPVSNAECLLGQWLYSDGQVFKGDSWFDEVVNLHEKSHDAYSKLYHETQKIYNPKTHDELHEYFINLETYSHSLVEQLEKAKDILKNMPEKTEIQAEELKEELKQELESTIKHQDSVVSVVEETESPQSAAPVTKAAEEVEPFNDIQQQLKKQDLQQLGHEKQLLALEIKQLEERHQLTEQGIDQLIQYQTLKQKELQQLEGGNKQIESVKKELLDTKKLELEDIIKEKQQKQQELERMELVSNKLEHKKNVEKAQDEEKLKALEQKKQLIKVDINQLSDEQQSKQTSLEQLEKQVSLLQEEILDLQNKKDDKSKELQVIEESFNQSKQEIDNITLKQQQINRQKQDVEKLKQKDLQQLEEKQQILNDEVKQLEQELLDINKQEGSSLVDIKNAIKQLDEEKNCKSKNLEQLKLEKQQKKQKLEQLEKAFTKIEKELQQSQSTDSNENKHSLKEKTEEAL